MNHGRSSLFAGLLAALALAAPAKAAFPGPDGPVVFTDNNRISTIDPSAPPHHKLIFEPDGDWSGWKVASPAISPDGRTIAFAASRGCGGCSRIATMPLDGSAPPALVVDGGDVATPAWSPDGRELVYSAPNGLYRVKATGGEPTRIPLDAGLSAPKLPAFSPDATRIAFSATAGGDSVRHIYVLTLATGAVAQVTTGAESTDGPAWSPDGETLAYVSDRQTDDHLGVTGFTKLLARPVDGGAADVVYSSPDAAYPGWIQGRPAWSPDGEEIAISPKYAHEHNACKDHIRWFTRAGAQQGDLCVQGTAPAELSDLDWGVRASDGEVRLITGRYGEKKAGGRYATNASVVSGDGRYVVFESRGWDVIEGLEDHNEAPDIFRRDLATGKTVAVSVEPDGGTPDPGFSTDPVVSRNGRFVAFRSTAPGLDPRAGGAGVYLRDVEAGTTTLVSRDGSAGNPLAVSDDGDFVLYAVPPGSEQPGQLFRYQVSYARTDRIGDGAEAGFMSADGRYVAFSSPDGVFRRDMLGETETVASGAGEPEIAGLSEDGTTVLWSSNAADTVPGFVDNNGEDDDLYIRRAGAPARLVTGKDGSATEGAGGGQWFPLLSADGKTVVFASDWRGYDSQVSPYGGLDLHTWARGFDPGPDGKAQLAPSGYGAPYAAGSGGEYPAAVSADGRHVLVLTTSDDVADPPVKLSRDTNVLVRFDRVTRRAVAVSALDAEGPDRGVAGGSLSRDGRVVAFTSQSTNLVAGFENNNDSWADGYAWVDRSLLGSDPIAPEVELTTPADGAVYRTGRTVLAGYSCSDEGESGLASCEGTVPQGQPIDMTLGSHAFTVTARDGAGNTTTKTVHYRVAEPNDKLTLASQRAGGGAADSANAGSYSGVLSAGGRYLVFYSAATNLVAGFADGNGDNADVYRRDLQTGQTQLVSGHGDHGGNGGSWLSDTRPGSQSSVISADGRYVVFLSMATDLVDGFTGDGKRLALYVRDMKTGEIRLVDHARGNPKQPANGFSGGDFFISRDGSTVAFESTASDLTEGASGGRTQVYVYDVAAGGVATITGNADSSSALPRLSADGTRVLFQSDSSDLLPGHPIPPGTHLYWHDRTTGAIKLVDHRFDSETAPAGSSAGNARLSADGRTVLFDSFADDVVAGFVRGDDWNARELYTRDMVAGGPARLVTASAGDDHRGSGGNVEGAELSDDGTTVAWRSRSTRIVAGFADHNGADGMDLFVRRGGEPARLAVHGAAGQADGYPESLDITGLSSDGRLLAFAIGVIYDESPQPPVDLRRADLLRDRTVPVATAPDAWIGDVQMSPDGQRIAFAGRARNLVDGFADGNGEQEYDLFTWTDEPPVAKASSRVTGPLTVVFDASESSDPDGKLADYRWDFGDGATGAGRTATHAYAAEGAYTVKLTVEDDGAHEVSTTLQIVAIKGVLAADGAPFDFLGIDRTLGCNAVWPAGSVTCATLAAYGGVVYGPGATAFTPVSQELADGRLVTTVALGTSGVRLRQTDAYRAGEGWYRTDVAVLNDGADPREVTVYRFARCAIGAAATRAPLHDAGTAMAGCGGAAGAGALLPLSPGARHAAGGAGAVLGEVLAGGELSNACACESAADPGAAIGWRVTAPAHGQLTRGSLASFGPDGSIPVTVAVAPEKDTAQPLDENAFTVTLRNPNAAAAPAGGLTVTPDAWDYIAGSTTGLSTAEPVAAGGRLAWSGDWSVPGHGSRELGFRVTHRAGERISTTTALATGGRFGGVTSASLADVNEAKAGVDVRSVEGSLPNTAIYGGPSGPTGDDSPSFELVASKANVHFECRLGDGEWSDCASPFEPGPLRDGEYTLEVRAVDAAGTDPTPATRSFTVDTLAPNTAIASGPRAVTTDPKAVFGLRASEPGARFECRTGPAWQRCDTPYELGPLADGKWTFEARAIDAAGNADPTPATWEWEVDTTPPVTVIDGLDGEVLGASRSSVSPSTSAGGGRVAVGGDGTATIEVACPAGAGATCAGTIGLATEPGGARAARAVPANAVALARAEFSVAPGRRAAVRLRLPIGARNTVDREGRMAVFVTLDLGTGPVRGDDLTLTPDPRTARLLDAGRDLTVVKGAVTLRLACAAKCSGRVTLAGRTKRFAGRRMKVRLRAGRRGTQTVRITTKPALTKRLTVTLRAKEARR